MWLVNLWQTRGFVFFVANWFCCLGSVSREASIGNGEPFLGKNFDETVWNSAGADGGFARNPCMSCPELFRIPFGMLKAGCVLLIKVLVRASP